MGDKQQQQGRKATGPKRMNVKAALYGHILRLNGLNRRDAAALVIQRYPHTAPLLSNLLK